jgi:hypothetical protein
MLFTIQSIERLEKTIEAETKEEALRKYDQEFMTDRVISVSVIHDDNIEKQIEGKYRCPIME